MEGWAGEGGARIVSALARLDPRELVALAAARELVASPALGAAARRALVARVAALRSDAGAVRALLALLSGGPPLGAGELRDLVALVGRHGGEAAVAEGLAELVPRAVRGLDTGACSALRRDLARAMDQNPQLVPPLLRALRGGHDDRLWAREHSLRAADASLRLLPRAAAEAVLSALLEDLDEDCAALVAGQGSATTTESLEHDAWAAVDLVIAAAELGGGVSEGLPLAVHVAQHLVHSSGGAAAPALLRALTTDASRVGLTATLLGGLPEQPSPSPLSSPPAQLSPARAVLLAALCALAEDGAGLALRRELSAALRRARLPRASALAGAGMCAAHARALVRTTARFADERLAEAARSARCALQPGALAAVLLEAYAAPELASSFARRRAAEALRELVEEAGPEISSHDAATLQERLSALAPLHDADVVWDAVALGLAHRALGAALAALPSLSARSRFPTAPAAHADVDAETLETETGNCTRWELLCALAASGELSRAECDTAVFLALQALAVAPICQDGACAAFGPLLVLERVAGRTEPATRAHALHDYLVPMALRLGLLAEPPRETIELGAAVWATELPAATASLCEPGGSRRSSEAQVRLAVQLWRCLVLYGRGEGDLMASVDGLAAAPDETAKERKRTRVDDLGSHREPFGLVLAVHSFNMYWAAALEVPQDDRVMQKQIRSGVHSRLATTLAVAGGRFPLYLLRAIEPGALLSVLRGGALSGEEDDDSDDNVWNGPARRVDELLSLVLAALVAELDGSGDVMLHERGEEARENLLRGIVRRAAAAAAAADVHRDGRDGCVVVVGGGGTSRCAICSCTVCASRSRVAALVMSRAAALLPLGAVDQELGNELLDYPQRLGAPVVPTPFGFLAARVKAALERGRAVEAQMYLAHLCSAASGEAELETAARIAKLCFTRGSDPQCVSASEAELGQALPVTALFPFPPHLQHERDIVSGHLQALWLRHVARHQVDATDVASGAVGVGLGRHARKGSQPSSNPWVLYRASNVAVLLNGCAKALGRAPWQSPESAASEAQQEQEQEQALIFLGALAEASLARYRSALRSGGLPAEGAAALAEAACASAFGWLLCAAAQRAHAAPTTGEGAWPRALRHLCAAARLVLDQTPRGAWADGAGWGRGASAAIARTLAAPGEALRALAAAPRATRALLAAADDVLRAPELQGVVELVATRRKAQVAE